MNVRARISLATATVASLMFVLVPVAARGPIVDETRGVLTLAPMLQEATPAVVNIAVLMRVSGDDNPLLRDPFFRRYFGLPEQGAPERRARSAGSGVIIDAAKGYIVTNHHVVKDAERIAVTLKDGRQVEAVLVGSDAGTDIALVKIGAQGISALPLGNSDDLRVGDVVLAIGNPFGLGQTVTSGIVSALGRSGLSAEAYEDFIQTDAPINPGNSGGALINSKGELIGVNSAILAPSGGNVGIGFAVPVNMMKAVVAQLEKYGAVRRGRIGVTLQTVTPDVAAAMGLARAMGAIIGTVEKGTPAEKAGIKSGDVVIEIDGKPVVNASDVRNRIGLRVAGSNVEITLLRQGNRQTVSLPIAAPK